MIRDAWRIIHCCGCGRVVAPRLTNGKEIYPHREDLYGLPFWKCDTCGNFVGCHHKTPERTKPLGSIPTPELREKRKQIHAKLDPMWKYEGMSRGRIYATLSDALGYVYHTAEVNTEADADFILNLLDQIKKGER